MKVYKGEVEPMQKKLPRALEELDDLAPNDKERDDICKRLTPEDRRRLMGRYQ
jgi:hypothetical protein